jgi:hypothetical protein
MPGMVAQTFFLLAEEERSKEERLAWVIGVMSLICARRKKQRRTVGMGHWRHVLDLR